MPRPLHGPLSVVEAEQRLLAVVVPPLGDYPGRQLNTIMWGSTGQCDEFNDRQRERLGLRELPQSLSAPRKLGGCGRPHGADPRTGSAEGVWVPIVDVSGEWRPGGLAACGNAALCDFDAKRTQIESSERFRWTFEDWTAGGGQLLGLRLSMPFGPYDDFRRLVTGLRWCEQELRKTPVWGRTQVVDRVRVLHERWTPPYSDSSGVEKGGLHVHFHVVGLVRPGVELDVAEVERDLQMAWRDVVRRGGFAPKGHRLGLFGRLYASAYRALYAWSWSDDDQSDDYHPQKHLMQDPDLYNAQRGVFDDREGDDDGDEWGSWSVWDVARAALAGDQRAWRVWEELCIALKGVPVVKASRRLDAVWARHLSQVGEGRVPLLDPVAMAGGQLWESARRGGCTDAGLRVASAAAVDGGTESGVLALAEFWAERLGVHTIVDRDDRRGVWLVWADGSVGPREGSPVVSVLCSTSSKE